MLSSIENHHNTITSTMTIGFLTAVSSLEASCAVTSRLAPTTHVSHSGFLQESDTMLSGFTLKTLKAVSFIAFVHHDAICIAAC